MSERPIIFSGPMVRAILDRRKTQTRRIIKRRKKVCGNWFTSEPSDFADEEMIREGWPCPYGVPGDRLWVRETWRLRFDLDYDYSVEYKAEPGMGYLLGLSLPSLTPDQSAHFTSIITEAEWKEEFPLHVTKWRPSIHMPRWASRLTLEVKAVRVERLEEISEEDAISSGLRWWKDERDMIVPDFSLWWYRRNAEHLWRTNPWVWVVEFEEAK